VLEEERQRKHRELEYVSRHDPLTGVGNRSTMDLFLARWLESEDGLAFFMIDLDGFKPINDRFGHAAGDHVLQTIASRLEGQVRSVDLVARLGGDEFGIAVTGVATELQAEELRSRYEGCFDRAIPFEGKELHAGASVGFALASSDINTAEALQATADQAMYRAKAKRQQSIAAVEFEAWSDRNTRRKLAIAAHSK
jgi:diguanylate cyclase (GGDEF)-like protein